MRLFTAFIIVTAAAVVMLAPVAPAVIAGEDAEDAKAANDDAGDADDAVEMNFFEIQHRKVADIKTIIEQQCLSSKGKLSVDPGRPRPR